MFPIELPRDVISIIFEYDSTYRNYFTNIIHSDLLIALRKHFEKIHKRFGSYTYKSMNETMKMIQNHFYLKLTNVYIDEYGRWKCNGGVYTNQNNESLRLGMGFVDSNIPFPIPAYILAEYIYVHPYLYHT